MPLADDQRDSKDTGLGSPGPAGLTGLTEVAEPGEGAASGSAKQRKKRSWRQLVTIVVTVIVLMLLVKAFVVQVYRIPSPSMEDTLRTGDRVLVNKLAYHFRGIGRGDIVVFSGQGSWGSISGAPIAPPSGDLFVRSLDDVLSDIGLYSDQTYYIKRVIGLPGDRVACCTDGKVTVNGVPLDETSYLFPGSAPSLLPFRVTVPAGRLWVMGDNREDSADSRAHMSGFPDDGTIPENEVTGRAFLIIWPPSQLSDLPIPPTFQQAALHAGVAGAAALQVSGAAAGAVAAAQGAVAAAPVAAGVIVLGFPLLVLRRRRRP